MLQGYAHWRDEPRVLDVIADGQRAIVAVLGSAEEFVAKPKSHPDICRWARVRVFWRLNYEILAEWEARIIDADSILRLP